MKIKEMLAAGTIGISVLMSGCGEIDNMLPPGTSQEVPPIQVGNDVTISGCVIERIATDVIELDEDFFDSIDDINVVRDQYLKKTFTATGTVTTTFDFDSGDQIWVDVGDWYSVRGFMVEDFDEIDLLLMETKTITIQGKLGKIDRITAELYDCVIVE